MPLHILINYEASWRNSFLDGSNNEPLPKSGRNFIASITSLKTKENFKQQNVNINTVMGILCRLIGDQRKLYQAKKSGNYYFSDIEDKICFYDLPTKQTKNNELIYLRNISGNTDKDSFTGLVNTNDIAFTSEISKDLWGILFLELDEIFEFIEKKKKPMIKQDKFDPLIVADRLVYLEKMKAINVSDREKFIIQILTEKYSIGKNPILYELDNNQKIKPLCFYTSALYLQIELLQKTSDMSKILTKNGGISGISKKSFTKKDFMDRYTTGKKKLIFGNPYLMKEKIKGQGEQTSILTKASGTLEININLSKNKANELMHLIDCAGVSSFYLGKKGLAYVDSIHFIEDVL